MTTPSPSTRRPGLEYHEGPDGLSVRPISTEQVASVVTSAGEEGRAVYAGEAPPPGSFARGDAIRVDLSRMATELAFAESSMLIHVQAGMRVGELAAHANARGGWILPLPARTSGRTIGALLAAPRAVEGGSRGRLVDACAAVEAVLADGRVISTRLAPRKATGPDLLHALVAARGATGIITSAWLRLTRTPAERRVAGWSFPDGNAALAAARALLHRGARPVDILLADPERAGPLAAAVTRGRGRVLVVVHFDGAPELVGAEEVLAGRLFADAGAAPLADARVDAWLLDGEPDPDEPARFVPARALVAAWSARAVPSLLRGLSPAGAALCPALAASAPAAINTHRAALARALDPSGRFAVDPRGR